MNDEFKLQIEAGWKAHDSFVSMIKFADAKIGGFLTIGGVLTGFGAKVLVGVFEHSVDIGVFGEVILILAFFLIGLTVLFSLMAVSPRPNTASSLLAFPDVSGMEESDYSNQMKSLNSERVLMELSKQCHALSVIASSKYRWINRASTTLILAVILTFTLLIFKAW